MPTAWTWPAAGATSTANWVAHRTIRLAKALEAHEPTRTALAEGRVHVEQATVIARAVDDLPDDLDPDLVAEAEAHLVEQAQTFDAKQLKILGRRLLEVVAPEAADAHEARLLEQEERKAAAGTRFSLWEDGHGQVHGRFTLDTLNGAILKKALLAFAAPKHRAAAGPLGERKPTPQRLGQAFAELIHHYPVNMLPQADGVNATVVVTLTHDSLQGGLQAANLDTGHVVSASLARRLACQAGIIPAVLGTDGTVLDLGRQTRLFTTKQRIALGLTQRGCTTEDCDYPPGLCHAHHDLAWTPGREDRPGQRPTALPQTPPARQRPDLHDHQAPRREGRLHQTDLIRTSIPHHSPEPQPTARATSARSWQPMSELLLRAEPAPSNRRGLIGRLPRPDHSGTRRKIGGMRPILRSYFS
jgi:hypothetical protein